MPSSEIRGNRKLPNLMHICHGHFKARKGSKDRFVVLKDYYSGAKPLFVKVSGWLWWEDNLLIVDGNLNDGKSKTISLAK